VLKISLVVPVFNEEDAIPLFYKAVREYQALKDYVIEIVFVNDGSNDGTQKIASALAMADPAVLLVSFSRNFGKEPALFAGLEYATGDAVIPMDVDLQDPIETIPALIEKWQQGADVVLAKRTDRSHDSPLKRKSAEWFYKLHNKISHPKIEENVGDFRLMSRQVVEELKRLSETQIFMKGLLGWVGFETAIVEYARPARIAGRTKFNGWKLWNLALEGITGFSTVPLRMWTYLGLLVSLLSFLYAAWMIIKKLIFDDPVQGYTSIMVAILFLGGIQLIGIGTLGEYIGRTYMESKRRPKYIIKDVVNSAGVRTDLHQ
jgi:glycosyltransferase involved in cell wall biosynthesis